MFIAILQNENDNFSTANLYTNNEQFKNDTFSPCVEIVDIIPLFVSGKTYAEKKDNLRETAKKYSCADLGGISYGETSIVTGFFEKNARRYGLTNEFKSEMII